MVCLNGRFSIGFYTQMEIAVNFFNFIPKDVDGAHRLDVSRSAVTGKTLRAGACRILFAEVALLQGGMRRG